MEGMNPDGYRPKMGRTKASNRRVINLEMTVAELSKRLLALEKLVKSEPKPKAKAKKDDE